MIYKLYYFVNNKIEFLYWEGVWELWVGLGVFNVGLYNLEIVDFDY